MIEKTGKAGTVVRILADSISQAGKRMITFELEYSRLILAELNTHRQLSKNSFSSRAVPFLKMLDQLNGEPVRFGANQAGMQDRGEHYSAPIKLDFLGFFHGLSPKEGWSAAKVIATRISQAFFDAGYHKQVYNRLLEPFQMMKTVLSATEVDNFFWLRDDDAADPTLRELARVMREAADSSKPEVLAPGEWHLPYVDCYREVTGYSKDDESILGPQVFYIGDLQSSTGKDDPAFQILTLQEAIKVSCARCAAVSYRNEGYDLAKSLEVYDRLVGSERKHASAFEHQATPMRRAFALTDNEHYPTEWEKGISHMDRDSFFWSGNLQGWIQYRKLIPNECYHSSYL